MTPSPTAEPTPTDTNNPFTRNLLRSLAGTVRAQPDEIKAEYAERFAAATAALAAFHPRDPVEQLLAAQIVGASYAALDCLNKAAETEDPAQADRLRRSFATMNRTMRDTLRLLNIQQKRPVGSAPAAPNPPQQPIHREKPRPGRAAVADPLDKDPAEMSDAELEAIRIAALADPQNPLHREVSALQRGAKPTQNGRLG
jgi:hypothetical protein